MYTDVVELSLTANTQNISTEAGQPLLYCTRQYRMPKKITLKTSKNNQSVAKYIASLPTAAQADAQTLLTLFTNTTGAPARMWGNSIIGFGEYTYHRSNGDEGQFLATGFSMRQSGPTLYILPGYEDYKDLLEKIGPHKLGKSCLYLKSLEGIHLPTIKKLIKAGLRDLQKQHSVSLR